MNKDQQIIKQIEKIRSKNNSLWMRILSIAFKYAADESRKIFRDIIENDKKITQLSKELCEHSNSK